MSKKPYPSDASDEAWSFVAPYLALIDEQAPQRRYSLREVFNALCWLARAGAAWRMLPNDLVPWAMVYQQFRRWDSAGCFEAMVSGHALDCVHGPGPPGSAQRCHFPMAAHCKAVAKAARVPVTPANEQARAQVDALCQQVQAAL